MIFTSKTTATTRISPITIRLYAASTRYPNASQMLVKRRDNTNTVESFKETSVMLTTQNGSIEVQKYKLPLEFEVGDILIQNEFGIYEKK